MKKLFFVISNLLDDAGIPSPVVYLIDDDEDDRDIFSIALENARSEAVCLTAKNGPEALKSLNDIKVPDYIFIDLNMPYMSGRECLQEIKKRPMLRDVPAVVYTTSSQIKDANELMELGAAHFLVKPNSMVKLTGILKELLSGTPLPYYINLSA